MDMRLRLRDIMRKPVLTVTFAEPASDALARMRDAGVRHGVVLDGSSVVGVVSERDLGGPAGGLVRRRRTIGELMSPEPTVASPAMSLGDAVHLVRERHLGCLPVLEHGELVGIVTRSDLLRALDPDAHDVDVDRENHHLEGRPEPLVSPNRDRRPG